MIPEKGFGVFLYDNSVLNGVSSMLYIIANETAGSGAGAAAFGRVRALLQDRGIPFRADRTEFLS